MWIKRLKLENFQNHSEFETELVNGVNVLHGETDAGKSCIIRAVKWVMFNEPKGDVIRRTGTSRTSVTLTLDNDVVVTRIKSDTENAYIVSMEGETRRYDSIGKSIPDDVQKLLSVSTIEVDKQSINLNVASQMALPFLLSDTGSFRMRLFNKLSGNDIIDSVLQSLNGDILRVSRDLRVSDEERRLKSMDIEDRERKQNQVRVVYNSVKKLFDLIDVRVKSFRTLNKLYHDLLGNQSCVKLNDSLLAGMGIPNEEVVKSLKDRAIEYQQVVAFSCRRVAVTGQIKATEQEIREFLLPDEEEVKAIKLRVDRLKNIVRMSVERRTKAEAGITLTEKTTVLDGEIIKAIAQYKTLLREVKVCPLCKGDITDECLDKIKL